MKIPVPLFVIIAVVLFLALRRKPSAGIGSIASTRPQTVAPSTRAQTVAQMIERYAAVAGQDEALDMLAKLELDPDASPKIVNALLHAPGMSRAIEKAIETHVPQATSPPRKRNQKAAKPVAERQAHNPVPYGLHDEIVPLGALPQVPPLRHMRPLPKLAALSALPPLGPMQPAAVRSARSDSWRS